MWEELNSWDSVLSERCFRSLTPLRSKIRHRHTANNWNKRVFSYGFSLYQSRLIDRDWVLCFCINVKDGWSSPNCLTTSFSWSPVKWDFQQKVNFIHIVKFVEINIISMNWNCSICISSYITLLTWFKNRQRMRGKKQCRNLHLPLTPLAIVLRWSHCHSRAG
jgi:hypothetical protein